jgi:hypothetical protein
MMITVPVALDWTRSLWKWLVENPGKPKSEWPEWEDFAEKFQVTDSFLQEHFYCPLCMLVKWHEGVNADIKNFDDEDSIDCRECPLFMLWSYNRADGRDTEYSAPCLMSEYGRWDDYHLAKNMKGKTKYAKKIVALCDEALKDFYEEAR